MNPKNPPLPPVLRQDFARAAGGNDRARTATFINTNLGELGVAEWMEGYSVNGTDWTLKRMVLHPNADGGAISQHTQKQHAPMTLIEALKNLEEYEGAQAALGYILDGDDRGQVTRTPLFRDVARDEGIPHDMNGHLVVPQKGHIVEDGLYPIDAFAVAAVGHEKNLALLAAASDTSLVVRHHYDENGVFKVSSKMKSDLKHFNGFSRTALGVVRGMDLTRLLNHRYNFFRFEFEHDRAMYTWIGGIHHYRANVGVLCLDNVDRYTPAITPKLLAYLRYQFVAVDVLLRGVMAASMINQKNDMLSAGKEFGPRLEAKLQKTIAEWKTAQCEFAPLFQIAGVDDVAQLKTLNVPDALEAAAQRIDAIDEIARSESIDLSALPDFPLLKRNETALKLAPPESRALNTGPR